MDNTPRGRHPSIATHTSSTHTIFKPNPLTFNLSPITYNLITLQPLPSTLFLRKDLIQAIIQVFAVENDNQEHRHRDERVGDIKHWSEEQALARSVANQWEIEHIHHPTVKPTRVVPYLAVAHAIDDIAQRTRNHHRDGCQIARAYRLLVNHRMDIPAQHAHSGDAEEGQQQFAKPLNTKRHAVVLHKHNPEPREHFACFPQLKMRLDIHLRHLVKHQCQQHNARHKP